MATVTQSFNQDLWKKFHNEPEWFVLLGEKLRLLKDGAWAQSYIDCIYQYDWHHEPDICDLWVLLQVERLTLAEDMAVFQIPTGSSPYADKDQAANNAVLQRLPEPFVGKFWGGNQDADGSITWSRPVHVTNRSRTNNGEEIGWVLAEPTMVPLEVGYNSSAKFWMELNISGGCARWPYDQEFITVFLNTKFMSILFQGDKFFLERLKQSKETITHCIEAQRSPWERWKREALSQELEWNKG